MIIRYWLVWSHPVYTGTLVIEFMKRYKRIVGNTLKWLAVTDTSALKEPACGRAFSRYALSYDKAQYYLCLINSTNFDDHLVSFTRGTGGSAVAHEFKFENSCGSFSMSSDYIQSRPVSVFALLRNHRLLPDTAIFQPSAIELFRSPFSDCGTLCPRRMSLH